jgi:hypothetical protein
MHLLLKLQQAEMIYLFPPKDPTSRFLAVESINSNWKGNNIKIDLSEGFLAVKYL